MITFADSLRSRGRLAAGGVDRAESLDDGWWWGSSAPGQWDSPQTVLRLSQEPHWHACDGPVAPIDTLVRRLDSAALSAVHAGVRDWWLCRPLPACADRRRRWLELDGLAGRRAELWLHQVETGHQRLLLRSDSALLRHRVELPAGAADTVLWLVLRDEPVSAVGLWRSVRRVGERLAVDAPALRARLLDADRARLALRLRVHEPLLGLSMVLRHAGRRWQAPMALGAAAAGQGGGLWQGLLDVEAPALWWPHALGEPALHELELHALLPEGGRRVLPLGRIGWRRIAHDRPRGRLIINGVPMPAPLRRTRWVPGAQMSATEAAAQVAQARAAGIDLLDIASAGGPDADEALLDACDAQGLLIGHGLSLDSAAASAQLAQQLARWQARASLAWVRVPESVPESVITQVMQALPESLCLSGAWSRAL